MKILQNSAGQFTKFRSSLQQNCLNSVAYHSLSFVHKLSSVLLKTFYVLEAGMMLSYASNIHTKKIVDLFQKCNLSVCRIVFIYDCAVLPW